MRRFGNLPSRNACFCIIFRNRSTESTTNQVKHEKSHSTVDPSDVEHHGKLSKMWWDVHGMQRPLHALNALRVQFVRDGLANTGVCSGNSCLPLEGLKILDAGCGGGILSEPLARIGAEVTGLDASEDLVATAKNHAQFDPGLSNRLHYVCTTIEEFCKHNEAAYDAVVASEVIEHVNDKELFLKCCTTVLKPSGSIFLTTFNKTLPSWLVGIVAAEHILKMIPLGTHDWDKFISLEDTQRLLETYNCKTRLIHGMLFNPLNKEWFWTASTAVSYAIQAVKQTRSSNKR